MAPAPEYKINVTPPLGADMSNIKVTRGKSDAAYAVSVSDGITQEVHKASFVPEGLPADETISIISKEKKIGEVPVEVLQKTIVSGNGEVLEHYMQAALQKPGIDFKTFAASDTEQVNSQRRLEQIKAALEKAAQAAPLLLPELLFPLAPVLGPLRPFLPRRPDPPLAQGQAPRRKVLDTL